MTTSIIITDTGKRRTNSGTAEETDKANNGSAITLFGVELSLNEEAILNTSPVVNKYSVGADTMFASGEVDALGIQTPKWTVRGILRDNNATDMAKVKMLRDLVRTKGYKTISCTLVDWLDGSANSSTLNVRVGSLQVNHRANTNIIEYSFGMFETA